MVPDSEFQELLDRAKRGDREAEGRIYVEFKPHIERLIRIRLRQLHIPWAVEPPDVYDSVWLAIRQNKSLGNIKDALNLCRYLEGAVRKKSQQILRRLTAQKRDFRRAGTLRDGLPECSDDDPPASAELAEQIALAYGQLSFRETMVCSMHCDGWSWDDIATQLEISADAARMIHQRAEDRVRQRLQRGGGVEIQAQTRYPG